ncbi:AraC family transcriptional regulator [Caulobacter ginsengisoli]|uniref:AraC family transcriptional regulator n=1 Tax=Caulobacter ginsengisoli TaxID=400775 RepID=A0ABU0IML1_9CAUL|nr:AraC family transcriptional regulator [Caulobacter ginsengisoli]MDQ0463248.1 AraC family transcriptional regulator [Caulobacter ginsengisoli]
MIEVAATAQQPDRLERALAFVEAHLDQPLTLAELADAASLSPFHFARAFTARFDESPMAWVRRRRMAAAATQLASPKPPSLIDLALDSGFDSQEAFTRAFKRMFGVSPGRFQRFGSQLPHPEALMSLTKQDIDLETRNGGKPMHRPAFRVAGFGGRFTETNKTQIPTLWPKLLARLPVPGQTANESFGVCIGEADGQGMTYLAGAPIAADAPVPDGMEVREVPAQDYLVFRQTLTGPNLHPQMQASAREIWGERIPKSGYQIARGPDLEYYPADFDPNRPGAWVEWWVPVQA